MTDPSVRKMILDGAPAEGAELSEVVAPWDGRTVTRVAQASRAQVDHALAVAHDALPRLRRQSTAARRALLHAVIDGIKRRRDELTEAIVHEAGKPVALARSEVARALETFALAAAELTRFGGEIVPVDNVPAAAGTEAEIRRFAAGVVVGVVPFNFPLNLGAHKVAPALAVGAPIIIKPPPQAPSAQIILGEIALEAGADRGALQVLPCANDVAEVLATDARARVLSFTGSARVGQHLKRRAAGRVVLELGGNAAAWVRQDADIDLAIKRLTTGAWAYAGQICIKTQRIFVDRAVWDRFVPPFVEEAVRTTPGDPSRADVLLGPVIDDSAAQRVEAWVHEAMALGARVLAPLSRQGRLLSPCVLTDVPAEARVVAEEVFGPVAVVEPVDSDDDAIARINASSYGLQAAVFTHDLRAIRRAFHELDVGGVIVNDATTFRSDAMPYGGNKASGLGREGLRCAMEDFTDTRALVLRP